MTYFGRLDKMNELRFINLRNSNLKEILRDFNPAIHVRMLGSDRIKE
jgi:hypothetical protein